MIKRVIIAFFSLCSLNAAVYGSCLPNRFQKYSVGYHWDTLSFPAHKFSLKVCNDDSLGRSIFFSYGGEDFETFVQMDSTKILWEDIDFDGFEDALILVDVASNTSYESFLFDSKNKQYMHLRTIRNTALDKKRKMLLYSIHMGGGESSLYGFKIHKQKEYSIFIAHKRNETV
jgi:hypothetical protein